MFYDNSEPDFPNWWDVIDSAPQTQATADPVEKDSVDPDLVEREEREVHYDLGEDPGRDSLNEGSSPGDQVEENDPVPYAASKGYERELVRRVWEFAEEIPGNDADLWRKDEFGNWIYRLDYGRRESEFGWEIFDPGVGRHSQGVYAMRPLHWESFIQRYETLG